VERARVLEETTAPADGDLADRATNVDAHARLALIERRISAVEVTIPHSTDAGSASAPSTPEPGLAIGDSVTVDFGDGPEVFIFAPVELAEEGLHVITPQSPLGQALHGAAAGSTVAYATDRGTMQATLVAIS
jgi:transcription elongation factor GreA